MHIFAKNTNVNAMRRRFSADGVMHIYQRTISGFNLFYSIEDFLVFYTIVAVQARKQRLCLLGLCLMIDHIHILVRPDNLKHLSCFMSACTSLYVREFNARTGRSGSLFEPRYGSAVKMDGKRIRAAIAYLFNNPVEKRLCRMADVKSLITAPEDKKRNYISFLKSRTSASLVQIRKFLHMAE